MTKVLVVDDDTNICDLLKMYLEKEGYEVKTANDGVEGMTVFKMYEPDIVLLDIMLAGLPRDTRAFTETDHNDYRKGRNDRQGAGA